MGARPVQLDVYRTAIPMRSFEHAAAARDVAEAIVVRMECSDGTVGWGETLPRRYVTGETLETVPRDIEQFLWGPLQHVEAKQSSWEALDPPGESEASALPETDPECRPITAARCAASLAWHDAYHRRRRERESADERFSGGRIERSVRVSGVLGSADPDRTARRLWLMRLYGLRDFKLKLGFGDEIDAENLRVVEKRIGKAVKKGKCTLRVDANAAWQREETPARVAALKACGVCVVEQPVLVPAQELIGLAQRCELPLMADESVVTLADADLFLRAAGRKVWLNVRISKNGGPGAACRIAKAAAGARVPFVIGCMVGESSILSAAQRRVLQSCPAPRFVEGNYGRFLLGDDLTKGSIRFGYAGKLRRLNGPGMGVEVDPRKIARYGRLIKTLRA